MQPCGGLGIQKGGVKDEAGISLGSCRDCMGLCACCKTKWEKIEEGRFE